MQEKFLPIGTVVYLKNVDNKVMIVGYYSLEFAKKVRVGNYKIYDYIGTFYPEGLLYKNNTISFNNDDIESIEFIGYEDDNYLIMNNELKGTKEETVIIPEEIKPLEIEEFDKIELPLEEKEETDPKLFQIEEESSDKIVIPHYKFDENGIIINN